MIEEHEIEPDLNSGGDFEGSVEIGEKVGVHPNGRSTIVVHDPRATVAKDEPARDREPEPCHPDEIARDRVAARRDAEMRPPDIGAEIETVEDRPAVGRPRVVAAVQILGQGRRITWRYFARRALYGPS